MSEISKFRNEKKLVDDELLKILETDNNDNYLDDRSNLYCQRWYPLGKNLFHTGIKWTQYNIQRAPSSLTAYSLNFSTVKKLSYYILFSQAIIGVLLTETLNCFIPKKEKPLFLSSKKK